MKCYLCDETITYGEKDEVHLIRDGLGHAEIVHTQCQMDAEMEAKNSQ